MFEPQIAALAAKHGTRDQLHAIEVAAHHIPDSPTHSADDRSFHECIAAASGNAALKEVVSHLWALQNNSAIFNRLGRYVATEPVWQEAEAEHFAIVNAIMNRQPYQAQVAMQNHLTQIMQRLRRGLLGEE